MYCHNIDHLDCTTLNGPEFNRELERAYTSLRTNLSPKTLFFAYPYGAYNTSTYVNVRDNGFRLQMVQERKFAADDIIVRQNVWYDSAMALLVKKAPKN